MKPETKERCNKHVLAFVEFLELNIADLLEINPDWLEEIVNTELHFGDMPGYEWKQAPMAIVTDSVGKMDIRRMVNEIAAVTKLYVPICDWLKVMVYKNVLKDAAWLDTKLEYEHGDGSITVATFFRRLLHTMLVFELLGQKAVTDEIFERHLSIYYNKLIARNASRFGKFLQPSYIKSFSVDKAYSLTRKIRRDQRAGDIKAQSRHSALAKFTLTTNILEAVVYDWSQRKRDRALVGYSLVDTPIGECRMASTEDSYIETEMSAEFTMLYFCWNLSYVLPFSHPTLCIGKLLQPLVMCAQPKRFIFARMHSLFMAANSGVLDHYQSKKFIQALPNQDFWLPPLVDIIVPYAKRYYANTHDGKELRLRITRDNIVRIPEFTRNLWRFFNA